jgi:hypothetical protein
MGTHGLSLIRTSQRLGFLSLTVGSVVGTGIQIWLGRKRVFGDNHRALENCLQVLDPALLNLSQETLEQVTSLLWASVFFPVKWR